MPDPRVHLREHSASREEGKEGKAVLSPSSGQRRQCDGGCSYSRAVRGTKGEVRNEIFSADPVPGGNAPYSGVEEQKSSTVSVQESHIFFCFLSREKEHVCTHRRKQRVGGQRE